MSARSSCPPFPSPSHRPPVTPVSARLAFCLLLTALPAAAQDAASWTEAAGVTLERVREPVFYGSVMLYEAGPKNAEPVVLLHGLGQNGARDWARVIPALSARKRVMALDFPGFGQSDKGNWLYSPDNYVRVVEAVTEKRFDRPFTLIGHSMGGVVALAYAAAHPERVSRLILVDVAGVLHRSVYAEFLARGAAQRVLGVESPWFEQVVRVIRLRAENFPLRSDLALENEAVRRRLLRGDPNAIAAVALLEHDFSRSLRSIRAPALIIWGAEDQVAPLRTGQALASMLPGARLVVLEGVGHAPQIQAPERFSPLLIEELDGRPIPVKPYALEARAIEGARVGTCSGARGQAFTGDYERIELENCEALINEARVGYLRATQSTVRVVNSHVRDGIDARTTRLEITGGSLGGGLVLDTSNVDAAGLRFVPRPGSGSVLATNAGEQQPAILRISISEVLPRGEKPRSLHDIFRLAPGDTLVR